MMEKDCYIAFPAGRQEERQDSGASFRFAASHSLHKRRSKLRKKIRSIYLGSTYLVKIYLFTFVKV